MFDSTSILRNRSLHTSFFYLGSSWVNLVNDILFFQEPDLTCTQFKMSRNAPLPHEEKYAAVIFFLTSGYFRGAVVKSLFQHDD